MAAGAGARKPTERSLLSIFAIAGALTIAGFILAYQFVQPAPPSRFTIATGSEEGAYHHFAQRFGEILERNGVELDVRATAGSIENLGLLRSRDADVPVAFVQSGLAKHENPDAGSEDLIALASLYYEPIWVFHRGSEPFDLISELRGKRVAIGAEGSGTRALALRILADNFSQKDAVTTLSLGNAAAAEALERGEIDAAFFIASPQSELVADLLATEGLQLMSFRRAEAYARRLPFLDRVSLPEGVIDPERGIPRRDVSLLAPMATLVCRGDFHPALIGLILQAATEVHGKAGIFAGAGRFPSGDGVDFPLSADARRFFRYGPPFLQRYMPFWAASLVDRLKIMLLPLFFLLLPFGKVLPPIFRWRIRSRIYRWYDELKRVDQALAAGDGDPGEWESEIDRIEAEVLKVEVPLSYAIELYALRLHLKLIRDKLVAVRGT